MPIEPWQGGGVPEPHSPKGRRAMRNIVDQVRLDGMQVAGEVALAEHTMALVKQMTYHRRQLAGSDEELNAVLVSMQIGAMHRIERLLDNRHSAFG